VETCHNKKRKVLVVPIATIKSTEHVVRIKTQLVKLGKRPTCYPNMIYSSIEHRCKECPKKNKVHNMFRTKLVSFNATTTLKLFKTNNVPINVVADVTTCNQQSR
jgi:7-cyano-7-deazaguanine synthase in queuosine biosynthesis